MAKVTMPQLGESVAEGTIGKWLKQPGDTVAKYEPLLEVITDKVNAEVPSPFAGILREILVEEGATVPNNAEIAVIETEDEAAAGGARPAPPSLPPRRRRAARAPAHRSRKPRRRPSSGRRRSSRANLRPSAAPQRPQRATAEAQPRARPRAAARAPQRAAATAAPPAPAATEAPEHGGDEPRMTPAVRRLLREHGLTASMIAGTGMGGRLTRDDVMGYVQQHGTSPVAAAAAGSNGAATPPRAPRADALRPRSADGPRSPDGTRPPAPSARGIGGQQVAFPEGADEVLVPMTQMRRGIANQMTRALQVPHAYVQMEVDATRLVKLREKVKKEFQAREGTSLSYMPFVAKAIVAALKRNPAFNAHWTENGLLAKRRINLGVAVAVPDGLIVPVVKDVDQLSIAGLNRGMAEVAARARASKLRLDDIQGGTFTLDNTGWFGSKIGRSRATCRPYQIGRSDETDSSQSLTSLRKAAAWAPSFARWSIPTTMFMIGRIAITSPSSVSTTTGRLVMFSIVRMATSGTLMIGIVMFEPNQPVLSSVKVPPWRSSRRSLLARARAATSAIARLRPAIESWSTSLTTGTMSPSGTATATPRLMRRLASRPFSVQCALKAGLRLSAATMAFATKGM